MKKTFLSDQAKEFRSRYNLKSSPTKDKRSYQKNLIVEEFKEFLEAEGFLFRHGKNQQEDALKDKIYDNINDDVDDVIEAVINVIINRLSINNINDNV